MGFESHKPNSINSFKAMSSTEEKEKIYHDYLEGYVREIKPQTDLIGDYLCRFDELGSKELTELKKQVTETLNFFGKFAKEVPPTEHFHASRNALTQACALFSDVLNDCRVVVEQLELESLDTMSKKLSQTSKLIDEYNDLLVADETAFTIFVKTKKF